MHGNHPRNGQIRNRQSEWLIRYARNVCPCHSPSATSTSTSCGGMLSASRTAKSISRCATLHVDGKYCDNVTGQTHYGQTDYYVCAHILGNLPLGQMDGENISRNNKLCCAVPCPRRIAGHLSSQEKRSDSALVLWTKLRNFAALSGVASWRGIAWQLQTGGRAGERTKGEVIFDAPLFLL